MKVFVVATRKPGFAPGDFQPHFAAESRRAAEMYRDGHIREIYSRADGKGAILIFEAADAEAVRPLMDSLPLVEKGMLTYEIYGAGPYRGFIAGL